MHFEPLGVTMKKKTRARFSADFKLEAAKLVINQNYSVRKTAQAMGVGKSTMDKWVTITNGTIRRSDDFGSTDDA